MSFIEYLRVNWSTVSFLTAQHVEVVLLAVGIATVVALLFVVATERSARVRRWGLSLTGTILTIPSFALFGLMIPLFGLGVAPTVLALTAYAIFPILRNAITGLDNVDSAVVDAARGVGMSAGQRLVKVRLPLAWPVILNGIRVSSIMVVAIAAIGAAVQGPGLGQLIFGGLARMGGANALNEALAGVVGVVAVAFVLDVVFLRIGRFTTSRGLHA